MAIARASWHQRCLRWQGVKLLNISGVSPSNTRGSQHWIVTRFARRQSWISFRHAGIKFILFFIGFGMHNFVQRPQWSLVVVVVTSMGVPMPARWQHNVLIQIGIERLDAGRSDLTGIWKFFGMTQIIVVRSVIGVIFALLSIIYFANFLGFRFRSFDWRSW